MPGLGASSRIFERIVLPEEEFDTVLLDWVEPQPNECLTEYAQRMAQQVTAANVVLVGVSFGGILVQEMAAFLPNAGIVIISSIKSRVEMPARLRSVSRYQLYRLAPTRWVNQLFLLRKFPLPQLIKKRLDLYEIYMTARSANYLNWSIREVVNWSRAQADARVIHIHGEQDEVFPFKNLTACIGVPKGTHVMILLRYNWFNENLAQYLRDAYLKVNAQ